MTIIVFLIDSSASMNQRTFIGARPTLLDMAKGAVENFVKLRQRNPESRFDRYMLFTSEEPPNHIKAGWKENLGTFMNELKNIRATGLSTLGPAIKNVFDVLNTNRVQSGIDTYGSGRSPFFLEPSLIICITDGGKLSSSQGVQDDIFPLSKANPIPGAELTREVFRWDQRLFGLVLRLTGTPTADVMGLVPSDVSPLEKLCEQTGGRSYAVRTHRMFQQCLENLVQKVQSGVVINFEKIGPDPPPLINEGKDADLMEVDKENIQLNQESPVIIMMDGMQQQQQPSNGTTLTSFVPGGTAWYQCRKMIYVPRPQQRGNHGCFWPIPESYWPDVNLVSLPARSAHPNLKFTCTSQEPMVIDNLPFDKYELEPSPLTQYILYRKQPTICWQVFISNSSKNSDVGHPFGYLKASTTKPCVNLFVMPYNYPVLLPLLDDLFKTHRLKPTKEWRQQFDNYIRAMPTYYITPLKRALERMGVPSIIPEKYDNSLSFQVVNNLKKLKNQAKVEYEKICAEVEKRVGQVGPNGGSATPSSGQVESIKILPKRPLPRNFTSNHLLKEKFSRLRDTMADNNNFSISINKNEIQPQLYRNPFDISRSQLVDQLTRMRANFLQKYTSRMLTDRDPDQLHCKPISQMGNYQDFLKKCSPPLREIESVPVRQHMFGNPFKIDKKMSMMVDEADVDFGGQGGPNSPGGRVKRTITMPEQQPILPQSKGPKRRKGPLSADFNLERYFSTTPPSSPYHHPVTITTPTLPPSPHPIVVVAEKPPLMPNSALISVPPSPPAVVIGPQLPPTVAPIAPPMPTYANSCPPAAENLTSAPGILGTPGTALLGENSFFMNGPIFPLGNGEIPFLRSDSADTTEEKETTERIVTEQPEPVSSVRGGTTTREPSSEYIYPVEHRNGVLMDAVSNTSVNNHSNVAASEMDSTQVCISNKKLLLCCYKEVKKPGRDFRVLFEKLEKLAGSAETQSLAVAKVLHEAQRFKRHSLVQLLTDRFELPDHNGSIVMNSCGGSKLTNNILVNGHCR